MADVAYIGPGGRSSRPLLRTKLGEVLRGCRLEQGRTLADVAQAARVSVQYLSEVERGRKEASSEVLAAVCDALRVELSDVLAEVGRLLVRPLLPAAGAGRSVADVPVLLPAQFSSRLAPRPSPSRPGDVVLLAA